MLEKLLTLISENDFDYIFMSAAVADYCTKPAQQKIKRTNKMIKLELYKIPDILKLITKKTKAIVIGFALETQDGEKEAIRKKYVSHGRRVSLPGEE